MPSEQPQEEQPQEEIADIVAFQGELVVDTQRGVIYFHDANVGITRLRICGLDTSRLQPVSTGELFSLDITKPKLVSYCG